LAYGIFPYYHETLAITGSPLALLKKGHNMQHFASGHRHCIIRPSFGKSDHYDTDNKDLKRGAILWQKK
jgi:hypothetical protein